MARTLSSCGPLLFSRKYAIIHLQEGLQVVCFCLGSTKAGEVIHMTSYEELIIVFTVIGLLLTAYTLGTNNRK